MIGFYDYTVILTYISLACSLGGMCFTFTGHMKYAVVCLALSGFLDAFDGKVARTKKNRTDEEKSFGIQIDSLCDMVCFGVFPCIICWFSGMQGIFSGLILIFYCLAGLIRLAYFNVKEECRQQVSTEKNKYYSGMPITSISVILPITFACSPMLDNYFDVVLRIVMIITGLLFILNFKFRKPTNKELAVIIIGVGLIVIYLFFGFSWKGFFKDNIRNILQYLPRKS